MTDNRLPITNEIMSIKDQLTIRPMHPDDAEDQYAIVAHPAVAENLMQLPSMEFAEVEAWIQAPKPGTHRLVADLNGRHIGSINLQQNLRPRMQHSGKIGMMVHPDFWGQGVGAALMTAALDLADNWLNLQRVWLDVYSHNEAAKHLYRKFGFVLEGTKRQEVFGNGRYFDADVMARLRYPEWYDSLPERPLRLPPQPKSTIGKVTIRPPRYPDDLDDFYAYMRQPEVGRTTLQLPSQEIHLSKERLQAQVSGLYRYFAEVDGRVVGGISLHQSQNPRARHGADLGMAVHRDFWGQGIGSQLLAQILELADNWLSLTRVELEVNTDNTAGVRLYEKFGFEIEGTHKLHAYGDGRMADSYFMARVR